MATTKKKKTVTPIRVGNELDRDPRITALKVGVLAEPRPRSVVRFERIGKPPLAGYTAQIGDRERVYLGDSFLGGDEVDITFGSKSHTFRLSTGELLK